MSLYEPPVQIQTLTYRTPNALIQYPQVRGLASQQAEHKINHNIVMALQEMERQQQSVQSGSNPEMTVHFEIKTNERGILSLMLSNYTYSTPMAHGYTVAKGLTFCTATGQLYRLGDLFKPGSNYEAVLAAEVKRQIKERDLPVLDNSVTVQSDQDFYLADKALVLFYPLYAITPYYVGLPMFPISVYSLQPIIAEDGPLAVLTAGVV
ncbi:hypothetical protein E6C60_1046 [Paenibacillus algicola]|uniref:DUF3298 domain-containing protein n=1 Tax=Paenibacillus algicola TaxID=2565926 RepID=A0A4V1G3N0_9BACL|nr:DUF3298 and DUF4163 domain-containing protein [Paenibacillus algicola]QCT01764.1 hypothetical protein E6C60_1046 [Paenibacillus algicola]